MGDRRERSHVMVNVGWEHRPRREPHRQAGHLRPPLIIQSADSRTTAVGGHRPRAQTPRPGSSYWRAGPDEVGSSGATFPWITPAAVPPPDAVMFTFRPGRGSSRRRHFWVGAEHGAERLGENGEGHVAVPAGVGAALEVVQAEAVLELAVVVLDGPVLADEAGQVGRGGVGAGQAGDGADGLAGGLAGGGVLPPAGDLDGLAGVREVQVADVGGLQGAGLGAAVPGLAGGAPAGTCRQGRALTWACSSGWLRFTIAM